MPDVPASLPTVVAVGGTTLKLTTGGARASETVWNDNGPVDDIGLPAKVALGATGGGCSRLFTAMPWQTGAAGWGATGCGTKRLVSDVSAVGDPLTGFDIYDSYKCGVECEFPRIEGGWATFGGTSLSTPLIAGMYGLAGGGHGLTDPGVTLYGRQADASSRFDVTSGGNGICGGVAPASCGEPDREIGALVDCEGTTACDAAPGFDGPSGVGTPNGLGLFEPELPTAVIGAPVSLTAGSPAAFTAGSSTSAYPGGTISGASWKWGDGTQSSGISPAHVYAAPGKYTVELTVTDSQGLVSAAVAQQVSVKAETEEEAAAKKKAEEEAAAKKKAEEEAAAKKKAEEEAAAKKKAEEEAAAKKKAEEAAAKKKAEEEALAKKKAEEAAASNEKAEQETAAAAKHAAEGQLLTPGLGVEGFHSKYFSRRAGRRAGRYIADRERLGRRGRQDQLPGNGEQLCGHRDAAHVRRGRGLGEEAQGGGSEPCVRLVHRAGRKGQDDHAASVGEGAGPAGEVTLASHTRDDRRSRPRGRDAHNAGRRDAARCKACAQKGLTGTPAAASAALGREPRLAAGRRINSGSDDRREDSRAQGAPGG